MTHKQSEGTIGKKFAALNIENTVENRRAYRDMLFSTPGIENYISGVILFSEQVIYKKYQVQQADSNGVKFPEVLKAKGIIPGIKVDKGLQVLPGT